jgi:hypothetical protein
MFYSEIPKIFTSDDVIYHYCDVKTAVEFILYEKKLRLSQRKNAIDPIESIMPWFSYSSTDVDYEEMRSTSKEAKAIESLAIEKINNAKQLSFCMNKKLTNFSNLTSLPDEYYGFLKPRMWDQYGDNYNGVCLAFSLKEIKKRAKGFVHKEVEYQTYSELKRNHYSIDETRTREIGVDQYWEGYSDWIEGVMFRKHVDYESENEYKFMSFSSAEYDYLDFKNSLKGIIVSRQFNSEFIINALVEYSKVFKSELLFLDWGATGINYTSRKYEEKLIANIGKFIKAFKLSKN